VPTGPLLVTAAAVSSPRPPPVPVLAAPRSARRRSASSRLRICLAFLLPSSSRPRLDLLSASFTGSISCSLVPRLDLLPPARWFPASIAGSDLPPARSNPAPDRISPDRISLAPVQLGCCSGSSGLVTPWIGSPRQPPASLLLDRPGEARSIAPADEIGMVDFCQFF
jgi:hypothetical protein